MSGGRVRANLTAGDTVGDYRIESFLARGGMAAVYTAVDTRLGRRVALKLLAPELSADEKFQRRFVRESMVAASIEHPNIVPIFEAGEVDDVLFIAMSYVPGPDLRRLLDEHGRFGLARAVGLFDQVAGALDAAHERGLVHRDVKPGNVLVRPRARPDGGDHVYLSDFGLTKRSDSSSGLTTAGHFIGTLDYIAPEQISGGAVDGRTDVYALGCVAFRALTGSLPFDRDNDAAVLYAHLSASPPAATALCPELPRGVDDVLARAMAKAPADRYPTCADMVADLGRLTATTAGGRRRAPTQPNGRAALEPATPRATGAAGAGSPPRRTAGRWIVAGLLALLALGAGLGVWLAHPFGSSARPSTVVLPFATERYPRLGMTVSRSWTLVGGARPVLRGRLVVEATRRLRLVPLLEALPPLVSSSTAPARFDPRPAAVLDAGAAVRFAVDETAGHRLVIGYEVAVRLRSAAAVEALQSWAAESLRRAAVLRRTEGLAEPVAISSLVLSPLPPLVVGGEPHLITVGGGYHGQPPSYVVGQPGVATVGADGEVSPHAAGTTTVTARLGPMTATTSVTVSASSGAGP